MRILKAWLLSLLVFDLCCGVLYYIAELLPEPFYAGIILLLFLSLSLLVAAFYLGHNDKGILLLQLPFLLLLSIAPIFFPGLVFLPEYFSLKGCLIYCLILLLPLFVCGFSSRVIYLQKSRKNEE